MFSFWDGPLVYLTSVENIILRQPLSFSKYTSPPSAWTSVGSVSDRRVDPSFVPISTYVCNVSSYYFCNNCTCIQKLKNMLICALRWECYKSFLPNWSDSDCLPLKQEVTSSKHWGPPSIDPLSSTADRPGCGRWHQRLSGSPMLHNSCYLFHLDSIKGT